MEKRLVPELRFPEFSGEWEEKRLGEISDFLDDKRRPIKSSDRELIKGKYPYYGASGIIDYINDYIFDEELILIGEDGANIITRNSRLVFLAKGKYWVNNHAHVIKAKHNYNQYFLCEYLESLNYEQYNTGTAQPKLNQEVCKEIKLNIPGKIEQTKIANFFTLIDNKIEIQEEKITNLEDYKNGMMQKIFSQEIRFKDENGKDYPDWEEKKLGSLCNITTGKLDANAMVEDGKYRFYTCAKDFFRIDKYKFDTEALLISGNGANVGYIHYYSGKFNAYQRTYVLDKFEEDIIYIKWFLEQYLKVRIFKGKNDGNTPYIVLSTLSEMDIRVPSLPEQNKIANFLSSLDYKIEKETEQLELIKELKNGIMQKIFI